MKIGMNITAFWTQTILPYPPPLGRREWKLWVRIWASVPSRAKIFSPKSSRHFPRKMQKAFCVWLEYESRKQLEVVLWRGRRPCDYAVIRRNVYFWVGRWTSDSAQWTSRQRNWRCCEQNSLGSQWSAETLETTDVPVNHFYKVDHSVDRILEL